jgi:hypothetical protein
MWLRIGTSRNPVNTAMNLRVSKLLAFFEKLSNWRLLKKGSAPYS